VISVTETFALGVYQTDIPYLAIWRNGHSIIRQGYATLSLTLIRILPIRTATKRKNSCHSFKT